MPTLHVWQSLCAGSHIVRLNRRYAQLRSAAALIAGAPLSVRYYRQSSLLDWVRKVVPREAIDRVLVFSSAMAQYALIPELRGARVVVDFVDVDSDKWTQFARSKSAWSAWLYRLEGRRLAAYEEYVAQQSCLSIFVSDAEAELFRARLSDDSVSVVSITNGVDTEYFSPDPARPNPYRSDEHPIVFTGAMDYWANVDAVRWFATDALPLIIQRDAAARFYIVGSKPTDEVAQLAGPHISVTGGVPDVRPFLEHARVVVAPMRIARGIQNKVLEGMAMAKPVITTPKGFEGIDALPDRELLLATTAEDFCNRIIALSRDEKRVAIGRAARRRVIRAYSWTSSLSGLADHLNR